MSDIVKGFEYEPDMYVIFEKDDLDKLKLKSTKVIDIEGFVDAEEVDPALYDAPYYLGPDGDVAGKTYGLLSAALKDSGKFGVGKLVLRDREDIVMVAPQGRRAGHLQTSLSQRNPEDQRRAVGDQARGQQGRAQARKEPD